MVGAYINISNIHHDRGNKQKELEYLMKSMEIVEGMDDPNSVALMKYNLAVFYLEGSEKEKSFELIRGHSMLLNNTRHISIGLFYITNNMMR